MKTSQQEVLEGTVRDLFKVKAFKFGEFTLKSGENTPIYVDMRVLVSYPNLMSKLSDLVSLIMDKGIILIGGVFLSGVLLIAGFNENISTVQLAQEIDRNAVQYDQLCGVPYTALPIATVISTRYSKPMILRRKESKNYGTKNLIEGAYKKGELTLWTTSAPSTMLHRAPNGFGNKSIELSVVRSSPVRFNGYRFI